MRRAPGSGAFLLLLAAALPGAGLEEEAGGPFAPGEVRAIRGLVEEGHAVLALVRIREAARLAREPDVWPLLGQLEGMAARGCLSEAEGLFPLLVVAFPDPGPDGRRRALSLAREASDAFERLLGRIRRNGVPPDGADPALPPLGAAEARFASHEASLLVGLVLAAEGSPEANLPLQEALLGLGPIARESPGEPAAAWATVLRARALLALGRAPDALEALDEVTVLRAGPSATREERQALEALRDRLRTPGACLRAAALSGLGREDEAEALLREEAARTPRPGEAADLSVRLALAGLAAAAGRPEESEEALGPLLSRADRWSEEARRLLFREFPARRRADDWLREADRSAAARDRALELRALLEAARTAAGAGEPRALATALHRIAARHREEGRRLEAAEAALAAAGADPGGPLEETCLQEAFDDLVDPDDPAAAVAEPALREKVAAAAAALAAGPPGNPVVPEALLVLGLARRAAGDSASARAAFERVPRDSPVHGEALLAAAELRLAASPAELEEALRGLQALEAWTGSPPPASDPRRVARLRAFARLRAAETALALGRAAEADRLASTLLASEADLGSARARALLVAAAAAAGVGDALRAAARAERLAAEVPGGDEARDAAWIAGCALDRGLGEGAAGPATPGLRELDEAVHRLLPAEARPRMAPEALVRLFLRLADRSIRLGHADLALADCEAARAALEKAGPALAAREGAPLRYRFARALAGLGRLGEAEAILRTLLLERGTADAAWVREALGEILERKGEHGPAALVWRSLALGLEAGPGSPAPFRAGVRGAREALGASDPSLALGILRECLEKRGGATGLRGADPAGVPDWSAALAEIERAARGTAAAREAAALRKGIAGQ